MTDIIINQPDSDSSILQNVKSGDVFEAFLQSQKTTPTKKGLSDIGAYNLRTSTCDILNHCNPHNAGNNPETTHLVVGYVQSGKTMSFTGVIAMAKDNGYRIAVVLTGVTNILCDQTSDRLESDLDIEADDIDNFIFLEDSDTSSAQTLIKYLRLSSKPLIIIPILKHHKHIDNLSKLFRNEQVKRAIGQETVLIIDDEADQASLNGYGNKNSKQDNEEEQQTSTYASIIHLRGCLEGNSYIQYTATPQANLLITTMDLLSPKSHTLLIPGEEYVGGKHFFGIGDVQGLFGGNLVRAIPQPEVYHKKENKLTSMPESLREALFLHTWAVVLVTKYYKRSDIRQLSMMVHPTDIIDGNKTFEGWINKEISLWSECFDKPDGHDDKVMLLEKFKHYFADAIQFYPQEGRPTFDEVKHFLPDIINSHKIYRITGDSKDQAKDIKWNKHRMNIVIGAQMINRGFTVKNLATTYMPRYTVGIANADTIEQRCRFFGYKMDYIESCRVFLPKECIRDYKMYVRQEEELRGILASCSSLKEYERRIMSSPHLRPTRINVIPRQICKMKLEDWVTFDKINGIPMLKENKDTVASFVSQYLPNAKDFKLSAYDSFKYPQNEIKKHVMRESTIDEILPLLTDFRAGSFSEAVSKSLLIRYLQYLNIEGSQNVEIIFMSHDLVRHRSVKQIQDGLYEVKNLYQGRSNISEPDNYCGDRNIKSQETITLQIHHIDLQDLPVSYASFRETYTLCVSIPPRLHAIYYANKKENRTLSE